MTESAWSARPVMGLAGTAEHRYMPTSAAFKPPSGELARCGRWVERAVWPRSIVGSMLDVTRLRVLVAIARNGSVTAAARALNYAQPSISHHIARLEAETGARLLERAGRGVRLTEAGRMLAERAEEIIGRLDAAEAELAAHVGLREGRVRLAAFPSALGTLVPAAAAWLESETPGLDLRLTEAEPPEALRMLRAGYVDAALVFQHYQEGIDDAPPSPAEEGTRGRLILDEPVYLVTRAEAEPAADPPPAPDLSAYAESRWIAGCERCRSYLVQQCEAAGFTPNIAFTTDDYVAVQALVAAGLGVTTLPGLCLRAARHPGLSAVPLPGARRHVFAITYGQPPDPAVTTRLLDVLERVASADGEPAAPHKPAVPDKPAAPHATAAPYEPATPYKPGAPHRQAAPREQPAAG
jgi:molybdate transport repressor ModE-like protein